MNTTTSNSDVINRINYLLLQLSATELIEFTLNNAMDWDIDTITNNVATYVTLCLLIKSYTNQHELYELSAQAYRHELYWKDMYIVWTQVHQNEVEATPSEAEATFNQIINTLYDNSIKDLDDEMLTIIIMEYEFTQYVKRNRNISNS